MRNFRRWVMMNITTLAAVSVSACKPTYEAPVDDPIMTTAPADAPYEMDFDQLNDDVIDSFSKTHVVFPFVKSMEISGNNDTKNIEVDIDIQEGVADEAVQVLLSDVTKKIDNNAYIQDFRIKMELHTAFISILCQGDVHGKRTYDAAGGRIQGCIHLIGDLGLHGKDLLFRQNLQSLYTIGNASVV